ncbi:hypothetical protein GH714_042473 [Hevea brasiliensis]|uniref:Photosystem I n=2 Tax=Mesangiospermae TaxID=1437183 RepID=A0A6A6MGT7_HEVBR|nr:hypothetical protein GH714_042473 [Hevea brasiliensis]
MALRFPRFSQGLAQNPTTRRIWFGIATAHDFESHDDITEERLYQNIFASYFGQLAIIFLWTSGNLFHVAWQGNFEAWVQDPLHVRPIAHAIWDPHFGQPAMEAFTRGGAHGPVNIAYSSVYQWCLTSGLVTPTTKMETERFVVQKCRISSQSSFVRTIQSKLFGLDMTFSPCRYSRLPGEYVQWNNFLDVLPHPQGLGPLFTGQWNLYAQNPDSGPGDFLVHNVIALGLHTTTLILVKGALDACGSKLMPDKKDFGYSFPCDGPRRGGTCDISDWDAFFLEVF